MKRIVIRTLLVLALVATFYVGTALIARAQEPAPPDTSQFETFLATLAVLATMVFPTIGITGGIKGLAKMVTEKLPALEVGPWKIPAGVYVSWAVALGLIVWGNVAGWMPGQPDFVTNPQAWAIFQWSTLALLANIVRNWAGLAPEKPPELPTPVVVVAESSPVKGYRSGL